VKDILLIGGGGHCHVCVDVIESEGIYQIKGIVLPNLENSNPVLGYPVIGTDGDLPQLLKKTSNILIAIGQIKNFETRKNRFEFIKNHGANFPIIKSSYAYCSPHADLGEGTIVNSNTKIGVNCIVNNKALIEHDVKIQDHCHISTGAIINGGVKIGKGSFVGSGSVIKEGVEIGKHVIIGAGQIVLKNVPNGTTVK
jgi:sugar O-acyltransferase (sialic acid O-acetyltransferase NeuD family)